MGREGEAEGRSKGKGDEDQKDGRGKESARKGRERDIQEESKKGVE